MTSVTQRWLPTFLPALLALLLIGQILLYQSVPDNQDLLRYFESSAWVVGDGQLYVSVFSEYPLLANLLFASVRTLNALAGGNFLGFSILWISLSACVTGYTCHTALQFIHARFPLRNDWWAALAWLSPGILFFSVMRFDIYPALATLLMLIHLSRRQNTQAAIYLGIAISLKGYALIFLPAIALFLHINQGIREAFRFCLLALALPLLSLLIVLSYADWQALLSPFQFHAQRAYNADSIYLLLHQLTGTNINDPSWQQLPKALQVFWVILPFWLKPSSFNELIETLTLVLLGVMSFSVFYSPQFAIWLLPIISLSAATRSTIWLLVYSLATIGYFLVAGNQEPSTLLLLITVLAILRFGLMGNALFNIYSGRYRTDRSTA